MWESRAVSIVAAVDFFESNLSELAHARRRFFFEAWFWLQRTHNQVCPGGRKLDAKWGKEVSKALWRPLLRMSEGSQIQSSLPSSLGFFLTLTFLFIPRSGEGDRDGLSTLASIVCFFLAREEDS